MEAGGHDESLIEWAVASKPHPNATRSGDAYLVKRLSGMVLVGAIDGLGHGPEAEAAATRAVEAVETHAGEPLGELVNRCDQVLRGTRGVAMSLARIDAHSQQLTWVGVGNVEGLLLPGLGATTGRQSLLLQGGVVGSRLPPLREARVPLSPGAVLVFATDGIRSSFGDACQPIAELQHLTMEILVRFGKDNDDALVLAVRYLGAAA